jgi:hypothetical protein
MITVTNAIAEYYSEIQRAGDLCFSESRDDSGKSGFNPGFALPPLDDRLERFFASAAVQVLDLGRYRDSEIRLLDLTCNPRTRTTKTFASLVMVARAVRYIQDTGESVLLVTPSSANKGGALRDAVSRAIECGIVQPHQLRIAIVVPRQGLPKLWSLPLSSTPKLRALNPVFLARADDGRVVKDLTRTFVREHSALLEKQLGLRVWHTYDIDNYRMADAVRAFIEAKRIGYPEPPTVRVHAQAVSSAFGLIGHHFGRRVLKEVLGENCGPDPQWLLVQHLGTPDLVLNHLFGSFSRENLPAYQLDPSSGLLVQSDAPSFPARTFALDEVVDSTFYSQSPATAGVVKDILAQYGGAGIVVSLQECLERYGSLRRLLPPGGPTLPPDPRDLREWALVMVLTGVLGAIERGLVPRGSEILVHVTGSYSAQDYVPLPREHTFPVSDVEDMLEVILDGKGMGTSSMPVPAGLPELQATDGYLGGPSE